MQKFLLVAFIATLILVGITEPSQEEMQKNAEKQMAQTDPKKFDKELDKIIDSMTLEEKIGQMIMMGVEGETITDDAKALIGEHHIGGVILFDRNMKTPEQTQALITSLKEVSGGKIPLFIATDEEGGVSARLKDYITPPTAAKLLGDAGDTQKAKDEMQKASAKLKEIGFNVNFAPVADLNLPSDRFYSSNPEVAANFVKEAAAGAYEGGLIPCVKHFPGFASVQYVNGLPQSSKTKEELTAADLLPYEKLKDAEFPYFIMVNNATYGKIDKNPAVHSKTIIKKTLREELNFQGIVITDDLSGAAIPQYTPAERAIRAVSADADMVLSCNKSKDTKEIYQGLLDACNKDKIPLSKINRSVKRILKVKLTMK